jgi:hypothetical protein
LVPPKLTPPPQPKSTQPIEEWGSSAMWIAALGGLLTRQPLTNSLNAAAGVMNAFRSMDSAAAQQAYDTWKVESDNALKMFEFSNKALMDELDISEKSQQDAFRNYQVTAKTLGDNAALHARDFMSAMRLMEVREAHADRMRTAGMLAGPRAEKAILDLKALDAVKALQAARATGDQGKITAATQAFHDATEQIRAYAGKDASATDAKNAAAAPLYDTAIKEVDGALDTIKKHPGVVGVPGFGLRATEAVGGWMGQKTAPAQHFESQITAVQMAVRNLIAKNHYMSAGAVEQMDDLVKGLGVWDTPESARESLAQIKDILNEQRGRKPEGDDSSGSGSDDDLSTLSNEELLNQLNGE